MTKTEFAIIVVLLVVFVALAVGAVVPIFMQALSPLFRALGH